MSRMIAASIACRTSLRRVAGCATSTGFAGHASAPANSQLTFQLDHSVGTINQRFCPEPRPRHKTQQRTSQVLDPPAGRLNLCALLTLRAFETGTPAPHRSHQ